MDPLSIIGYIVGVGGGIAILFSRIPKQTITSYEQLTTALKGRIEALEEQSKVDHQNHLENIKAIADLQGQIKVYKELPLQAMAKAMQDISDVNKVIAQSNEIILKTLKESAITLAKENSEQTTQIVQEQHVEHQTVESETVVTKGK